MMLDFEIEGYSFSLVDDCLSINGDPVEDDAVIALANAYARLAYAKAFEGESKS